MNPPMRGQNIAANDIRGGGALEPRREACGAAGLQGGTCRALRGRCVRENVRLARPWRSTCTFAITIGANVRVTPGRAPRCTLSALSGLRGRLQRVSPPPASADRRSSVKRYLLGRRRERPGHLKPALLAEDEAHLAGRAKTLGVVGAKRRARASIGDCAEEILVKEAVLTTRLCDPSAPVCHPLNQPFRHRSSTRRASIKAPS
jgi:hypothetical protein